MTYDDLAKTHYDNISFKIDTPEGTANIIIAEESPGEIYKIFFTIGKAGSNINAWAFALAEMVVSALNHGRELADIISDLSNITSSRWSVTDGIACRSGPEALYLALMRYRSITQSQKEKVKYSEDYRPARWGV